MKREEVEGYIDKAIEKHLGKVGTSKFAYSIERISPYDSEAHLLL